MKVIMSFRLGPARSGTEISLSDVLTHPIWLWVWETGDETNPNHDETWQQPVLDTNDVTTEMAEPIIAFRIAGTDTFGVGSYRVKDGTLRGIDIWDNGQWTELNQTWLTSPTTLVAIPTIGGQPGVKFEIIDSKPVRARRVG